MMQLARRCLLACHCSSVTDLLWSLILTNCLWLSDGMFINKIWCENFEESSTLKFSLVEKNYNLYPFTHGQILVESFIF